MRLGIGRPPAGKVVADFVLSTPSKPECQLLIEAFDYGRSFVGQMVAGDIAAAMNKLNT